MRQAFKWYGIIYGVLIAIIGACAFWWYHVERKSGVDATSTDTSTPE